MSRNLSEPPPLTLHAFSTHLEPVGDRFDAWVASSLLCDFTGYASEIPFDAKREYARLGPFVLARREWAHPDASVAYHARRTEARIRADQQDFVSLSLQMRGSVALRSDAGASIKSERELYVLDFAGAFERRITPGREISLTMPRHLLPFSGVSRHGDSLSGAMASLLGDYLVHLDHVLMRLSMEDVPYVVEATTQLLTAALQPQSDTRMPSGAPIHDALMARVQRYIDVHLLEPDLTANTICKDVGISRATLYRLFSHTGGVMGVIRQKRLHRVHHILSLRDRPAERIRDVALRHGFTDEKYFTRIFKAQFGHAPSETLAGRKHPDHASPDVFVPGKLATPP